MLHYAPQTWTSDDTHAAERLKIQYGTSFVYPLSSMGAHVSETPNRQVGRTTPIETRANVALFRYEWDSNSLSEAEKTKVKAQIAFAKRHRYLIQQGTFYRLRSPFEGQECGWIVVSEDGGEALAGYYRVLNGANPGWRRLKLAGLVPGVPYRLGNEAGRIHYGDELMHAGIIIRESELSGGGGDHASALYHLRMMRE